MNNVGIAFLLTFLAGISTMIGSLFIFLKFKNTNKFISGCLSFAAGVMITMSITDLVPESILLLRNKYSLFAILLCILFILLGVILSMLIDYFIPDNNNQKDSNLYRVGIISLLAIILHNIPEGIATFIATNSNISLGISLAVAIAIHNIPEGISIAVPLYYSSKSKIKAISYTFVSALSETFGAVITFFFLSKLINNTIMGLLFALIAGIMLQISFCELLPTSKKYGYKKIMNYSFIIGIIFMLLKFLI